MPLTIGAPGVPFDYSANADKLLLPVMRGVVGIYLLGGSLARSCANLADPTKPASPVGAPVISAGFASFVRLQSYLDTGLPETQNMTLYAIGRSSASFVAQANRPVFIGNQGSSPTYSAAHGVTLGVNGTAGAAPRGNLAMIGSYLNGAAPSNQPAQVDVLDLSAWRAFAGTIGAPDVSNTLYDLTGNVNTPLSIARTRVMNASRTLLIGSDWASSGAPCDMALAVICNVVHTAAEIAKNKTALTKIAAKRLAATV